MRTLSFTGERQLRYPAPDVARGFMLALIALANVPFWLRYFPEAPHAGHAALAAMGSADQWWYLARTLFVDRRAYPLFSILFGFGMAIMASRTMERERRAVMETFTAEEVAGWHPVQRQIVEENVERYARRTASRLIRRRGWWMLAFGLVHAVFFAGDIIGAYGLVAVIFAEVIVMTRAWLRVLVGVLIGSLSLLGIWSMAAFMGREPMMLEFHDPTSLDAGYPLVSVASWLIATPMTVLTALVVPCVMIGVGVARWGLLQDRAGVVRCCPKLRCAAWGSARSEDCLSRSCSWIGHSPDRPPGLTRCSTPRGRGCVRLAGASGPRGRRPTRKAGHRVRLPQRDRSPFDDRLPVPDAALHPHLRVVNLLRCALAGRRRVRPDCARRVGADRPGLCHCRGNGIFARSS